MSQIRRLPAILAADVAGYSRLIGADEGGTLERLRALRCELLDLTIAEHGRDRVSDRGCGGRRPPGSGARIRGSWPPRR